MGSLQDIAATEPHLYSEPTTHHVPKTVLQAISRDVSPQLTIDHESMQRLDYQQEVVFDGTGHQDAETMADMISLASKPSYEDMIHENYSRPFASVERDDFWQNSMASHVADAYANYGSNLLGRTEDHRNEDGSTHRPRISLNPAKLLNPRQNTTFTKSEDNVSKPQSSGVTKNLSGTNVAFTFASANDDEEAQSDDDSVGISSFIERSHNLVAREDSPAKRQKLVQQEHRKKPQVAFNGVRSGGIISEHIKEQRRKAKQANDQEVITIGDTPEPENEKKRQPKVVDLTGNDEAEQEIVCYGKLDGASVKMHTIPEHADHKGWTLDQKMWKALRCKLWRLPAQNYIIHVRDYYNKIFGTIDLRVARALAPLLDSGAVFPGFRVDARLDPHARNPNSHFGDSISADWPITLNVYGRRKHATVIGGELRKKNVFLGAPTGLPAGTLIHNPHAIDRANMPRARPSRFQAGAGYVTRTNEEVERDINSVFNRVKNHEELKPTAPAPCVLTPLLAHQLQCLTFMAEREAEHAIASEEDMSKDHPTSLWRVKISKTGAKTYYNVITGNEEREPPVPIRGGIIADQMGLGKTLETLSHFASTIEESRELTRSNSSTLTADGAEIQNVGTTLLVCPKNVMSNWEDQIAAHLKDGSVKYYVYYGQNRIQTLSELIKNDLIITTYSIVSSEISRRSNSVLKAANWFRVILDEGHMIREQSTLQSRAVCELAATRRWVLTGTPVQNKLEDLGALLKFLRLKPFDMPANFSQYIIAPLKVGNLDGVKRLRTLVDVITLRRLKDRIDLLPRQDTVIKLKFSKEEQTLYNWVNQDAKTRVRLMDDKHKRGGRQMGGILRLISCLRMISDHGKELVREEELPDTKGISNDNPLVVDEDTLEQRPPLLAHAAYEMYHLVAENDANYCIECSKKVGPSEDDDDMEEPFAIMLRCYDLVCTECLTKFRRRKQQEAVNGQYKCQMCGETSDLSFFELTQAGIDNAEAERKDARLNPNKAKRLAKYEKPATKTIALLSELQAISEENDVTGISPPIKSVVFTEWTSHIDLLEIALKDRLPHINYVRLDGTMSRKQQIIAMNKLRDDDEVTLMLISIKAGGVGINLTAASRVFVMEPNWNPAAEAQAIDRVHRLGQKRAVQVTRFIMADSIEEQIARRQTMKKDLADMSMNRKVDNIKAKMERFKELFR